MHFLYVTGTGALGLNAEARYSVARRGSDLVKGDTAKYGIHINSCEMELMWKNPCVKQSGLFDIEITWWKNSDPKIDTRTPFHCDRIIS